MRGAPPAEPKRSARAGVAKGCKEIYIELAGGVAATYFFFFCVKRGFKGKQ